MASAAQIEAKVARGYGIAAAHLGDTCNWYRPLNVGPAIAAANLKGTLPASFTPALNYMKNQAYGKATWFALIDATQVQVGDYLVDPSSVAWFIASLRPLLPPMAVQCTRVVSFSRPQGPIGVGLQPYGGDIENVDEQQLVLAWPASVLTSTKRGQVSDVKLPGDVQSADWDVLVPAMPGVTLRADDIVYDDLGRRAIIMSAEITPLGWRLMASERET